MKANALKAYPRQDAGKGPARRLRSKGMVPAVFYGPQAGCIPLAVPAADVRKLLQHRQENVFVRLLIQENTEAAEKLSMIKEIQVEPVSGRLQHMDFYEVRMDKKLTFDLPLHFSGHPIGLDEGGELQHLKRELRVSCLPGLLPECLTVDVTSLTIGDAVRVGDLSLPEGIAVLDPGDVALALVSAMRTAPVPEGQAEEQAPEDAAKEKEPAA